VHKSKQTRFQANKKVLKQRELTKKFRLIQKMISKKFKYEVIAMNLGVKISLPSSFGSKKNQRKKASPI